MDCNSQLEGDEPCSCCNRSVMPAAHRPRTASVHWLRVRTAHALILVRLTSDDLDEGVPTIDLTEVT